MNIPLSLYIHIPWCIKKCPYCDFNSHEIKDSQLLEHKYIKALSQEIQYWAQYEKRPINSIFIGGGTPSLFSDKSVSKILELVTQYFIIKPSAEITIEINPGTIERKFIAGYKSAGINRVSLGVQSFDNKQLKLLGRIHNKVEAIDAVEIINKYFNNYNLDLMYGLPSQTYEDLKHDLEQAISCSPTHLSCYNLTIEPNTYFYKYKPENMPSTDQCHTMQDIIVDYLRKNDYLRYEISAYAKSGYQCQHNKNYWLFGDYIGIGAGDSSKITDNKKVITRYMNVKHPVSYMQANFSVGAQKATTNTITLQEAPGEFMMNALRLVNGFDIINFIDRTNIHYSQIQDKVDHYIKLKLLSISQDQKKITPTKRGLDMLNEILLDFI